jgi:MYXO-CTERM domain-containing protein
MGPDVARDTLDMPDVVVPPPPADAGEEAGVPAPDAAEVDGPLAEDTGADGVPAPDAAEVDGPLAEDTGADGVPADAGADLPAGADAATGTAKYQVGCACGVGGRAPRSLGLTLLVALAGVGLATRRRR